MAWKKIGKALLFPPIPLAILLLPVAAVALVCTMVLLGTETVPSYFAYALAAYTLAVWCVRIPAVLRFWRRFQAKDPRVRRWREDARLRVKVSLYSAIVWNGLYGIFQIWLGIYHQTFWFGSLGVYYLCLAAMRFFLAGHTRKYAPGEQMQRELRKYRACGWVFLFMNLTLSLIVFFMVYWNRTFTHHMITTIAMAAYTFASFTLAIVNAVRYQKYNSPVFSASKAISLAAACVSMLTLTSTMLTSFGDGSLTPLTQKLLLGGVGVAVSITVVFMAVRMIVRGTKQIKQNKEVHYER